MFEGLLENAGQYIQTNPWLGIVGVFFIVNGIR